MQRTLAKRFSKGVFLNVVGPLSASWRSDWDHLRASVHPEHVEIWLEYLPTREEISELLSILDGVEVLVHGPFVGMSFATPWEELAEISIERARRALEVAGKLNAQVVTFHAGTYPAFEEHDRVVERLAKRLRTLLRGASSQVVAIENMPRRGGAAREALTSTADLEKVTAYLQEVRFTLDIGHCLQNDDDHMAFLRKSSGRISNIHLHDGVCGGTAHRPLGTGELDLRALIAVLQTVKYASYVGLETLSFADTKKSWEMILAEEERLQRAA